MVAFFESTRKGFAPLTHAASQWSPSSINGAAVAGLAARALETEHGAPDLTPARLTVDLFSQPKFEPLTTTTTRVRDGRSTRVADVSVVQDDRVVARASVALIRRRADPAGARWQPAHRPKPPPEHIVASLQGPAAWWGDDSAAGGWSTSMSEHQNASRKRLWMRQLDLIDGEPPTPSIRAAIVGELTNTLTSWGEAGIQFINRDYTMVLTRVPVGAEIGLEADNHMSGDGIAIGVATMFDRAGRFGVCTVCSVAHSARSLDIATTDDWARSQADNERVEIEVQS